MRNLLFAIGGFLVGGGMIAALLVALPQTTNVTITQASPQTYGMGQMMGGSSQTMMASATSAASPALQKLTIEHVQKGCHVWSNGTTTAALMRMHLRVGQKLMITDMDVDAHQMLEFSGPMQIHLGGPMMMNHRGMTLAFTKKGVYRLGTKTVEMPGGGMDVKTIGPDNHLRLIVTVA